MLKSINQGPHRRFNLLTGESVLVSPHRTQRPWQGALENQDKELRPAYDENCYLCPGNQRAGGALNPEYTGTFAFSNDFAALLPDTPEIEQKDPLLQAASERGTCRVICFSPRHDLSIPGMDHAAVTDVIRIWQEEHRELSARPDISYVQIFENKGEIMGCSNPHPHCQIWASSSIPSIVAIEQERQDGYAQKNGSPLLLDYLQRELAEETRILFTNEHFVSLVPFWATWPFEAMILPRWHCPSLENFEEKHLAAYADAYQALTRAYDRVFDCEFPYSAGLHQAPSGAGDHSAWQLHAHFYPPLLRSATVRKFMVGYEMLASPQRDITPESAAEVLRQA